MKDKLSGIKLFLIIMTFSALFEIGGLLHSFSMTQIRRKTDIWSMIAAGAKTCRMTLSPRNWPMMVTGTVKNLLKRVNKFVTVPVTITLVKKFN